jgi:hypothetical protein
MCFQCRTYLCCAGSALLLVDAVTYLYDQRSNAQSLCSAFQWVTGVAVVQSCLKAVSDKLAAR